VPSPRPFVNPSGQEVWRVQWRVPNGKGGWSSRQETFLEEKEAAKFCRQIKTMKSGDKAREKLHRENGNTAVPTFEEYARRYLALESGQLSGIEPQTRAEYLRICELSLFPTLGDYPINGIDADDVGQWLAWQEAQPSRRNPGSHVAAKTVKNRHAVLSEILASAGRKYNMTNPARGARIKKGVREEPVFLTMDEYDAIMDASAVRWRPLFAFLVGSQLRLSEARALTWSDINRNGNPPTVRVSKAWKDNPDGPEQLGPPKSPKSRRTVSLWPALVNQLPPSKGLIFAHPTSSGPIPKGTIWKAWTAAVRRSGIGQSPRLHDLRHTGASWLIADGTPLPWIQARLGHEKITTTVDTYGHLVPEAHLIMADSLERRFAPQKEIEG
jgi:integrase